MTHWTNMNEKELEAFDKFWKKHQKCRTENNNNSINIKITGTAIGTAFEVSCICCHKDKWVKNITDYGCW